MKKFLLIAALLVIALAGCKKTPETKSYTVTFDTDGGTPAVQSQKVEKGDVAIAPATNPTKQGYVFLFWSLNGTATAYDFQTPVNSDITLKAKWIETLPALTGTVTIVGNTIKGSTLTANVENLGGSGDISYRWKRCDTKDAAGTDITTNGTGKTYTLVDADVGKFIKVTVSRADNSGSVSSNATEIVTISPYAEYFGTWRYSETDDLWEQVTISSDKATWLDEDGYGFTMSIQSWNEIENMGGEYTADYPAGYRVIGKMTVNNGFNVPKENGNGYAVAGDIIRDNYFMSKDKQSIRVGDYQATEQEAIYGPYYTKMNVEYWQVTWVLNGGSWTSNDNHATQTAKDGKLAAPNNPTRAGYTFDGWFTNAALTGSRVTFPYSATGNITLYAKWNNVPTSATLRVSVNPGTGFYTSITAQRWTEAGNWANAHTIPTSSGTHTINNVVSGTYRIYYSYWSCVTANCMSSGFSSNFSVLSGATVNVSVAGSAVGIQY